MYQYVYMCMHYMYTYIACVCVCVCTVKTHINVKYPQCFHSHRQHFYFYVFFRKLNPSVALYYRPRYLQRPIYNIVQSPWYRINITIKLVSNILQLRNITLYVWFLTASTNLTYSCGFQPQITCTQIPTTYLFTIDVIFYMLSIILSKLHLKE